MQTSLLSLFMPPKGHFGDFGLFCGFTASAPVLDRMRRSFSAETTRPVLAAFLHPTTAAVTDVPGLAWIWMRPDPARGYELLHAKVAILGFRASEGAGYVIRLAVTTGNWTADPLTGSIDLFWSLDLDTAQPDAQAVADLQAAWALFDWLRARGDCGLIEQSYDGRRPDALLTERIAALPTSDLQPRFIDSRREALLPQVVDRLASTNPSNRLIIGSGYYDSDSSDETVPERLRQTLISRARLDPTAKAELVLNPDACQGLAQSAPRLAAAGWRFRRPVSALHSGIDTKLHAKFVLLASGSGNDPCTGRLYLGSGNMTPPGFERAASQGGNLEAGVVIDLPPGLQWRRDGRNGILRRLPIGGAEDVVLTELQGGPDFERPEEPEALPEVAWLIWEDGLLRAPADQAVVIIGPEGVALTTPCPWPGEAPAFVTLVKGAWRLPVIAGGVLVVPRPRDLTVEDVLAGLSGFPEPVERDAPGDGDPGAEPELGAADTAAVAPPATYAIRRMMGLLVPLTEVQAKADARDWPRWCRELRDSLCALTGPEAPMLEFFRQAGVDPLPVVLDPQFLPDGAEPEPLHSALRDVASFWGLAALPSLWHEGDRR